MAIHGGVAPYMGFEKEPPSKNGPKGGGKHPIVHSHSAMPRRKVHAKRGMKKATR